MEARISLTEGMIVVLEFALAIGGLLAGVALLLAPDGHNLGWTTEPLQGTSFDDYWVPALILLALNGVTPIVLAVATLQRRTWVTWAHLVLGIVLIGWIGAQLIAVGYVSLLQPIFGAIGFIIAALAMVSIASNRAQHGNDQPTQEPSSPSGVAHRGLF